MTTITTHNIFAYTAIIKSTSTKKKRCRPGTHSIHQLYGRQTSYGVNASVLEVDDV